MLVPEECKGVAKEIPEGVCLISLPHGLNIKRVRSYVESRPTLASIDWQQEDYSNYIFLDIPVPPVAQMLEDQSAANHYCEKHETKARNVSYCTGVSPVVIVGRHAIEQDQREAHKYKAPEEARMEARPRATE